MCQLARVIGVASIVVLSGSSVLFASDINVPADYPTIQLGIDAAVDGDRVLVAPGTYYENLDFKGKNITVKSSAGIGTTVIEGQQMGSVVTFDSGETASASIEGFYLTHGRSGFGGGIYINGASPTIFNDWIVSNTGSLAGGGVYISNGSPLILSSIIANNADGEGAGVYVDVGADPVLASNLFFTDYTLGVGAGINLQPCSAVLTNNTFTMNGGPRSDVACVYVAQGPPWPTVTNCIVWGNQGNQISPGASGFMSVTYSDVGGGWQGVGNIDADPLFINPGTRDFHLGLGSPCVDAGDNSAPNLPSVDLYGDARIIGVSVDIGSDERILSPIVSSITPSMGRYNLQLSVAIQGSNFSVGGPISVRFGDNAATNVVVIDDGDLTCDSPVGVPGFADVGVSNSYGEGVLPSAFLYTPAITIDGNPQPGASITIHFHCDPGDGIFSIYGLPPPVSIPTPPYFGDLCILPFNGLFYLASWPFDDFPLNATIPNDPSLSGVQVLFQALVGPSLAKRPKDGAWTNCAILVIQ